MTRDKPQAIIASAPMGRSGHADMVAGCVVSLASELAGCETGREIDIDGGPQIH